MALRWNPQNVHAECRDCNRGDKNHLIGYKRFMVDKYGKNIFKDFQLISSVSSKLTLDEIKEMTNRYETLIKML